VNDPLKNIVCTFGEAMLEWQAVEENLFTAFQMLTGLDDKVAQAIYYSVPALHARLRMADSVAKQVLVPFPELLKKWKAIAQAIRTQSDVRNALAHSVLGIAAESDGSLTPFLAPPLTHPHHDDGKLEVEKIVQIANDFNALVHEFVAFLKELQEDV
jgi:hypothetical protein